MTDKEFKRLSRAQLIDIIYQLQLQVDDLTTQKKSLETALEDKRLRVSAAGNLAEAALEINNCFRSAQYAAAQYLNEIKARQEETEADRERILAEARAEAESIIAEAQKTHSDYEAAVEAMRIEMEGEREALLAQARSEAEAIVTKSQKQQNDYDAAVEAVLEEYRRGRGSNG